VSNSNRDSLRAALSDDYEGLAKRLTRCLGSSDLTIAEFRLEFEDLKVALSELSQRRQSVFAAAHIESIPHTAIAARLGINVRTVEFDLQHAMEHLSRRLGRKVIRRFGPGTRRALN
jgi:FixJ family two-component response regulator